MVYILLWNIPDVMKKDENVMRRVVELFGSFTQIETGLNGPIHNLYEAWEKYSAASHSLKIVQRKSLKTDLIILSNL